MTLRPCLDCGEPADGPRCADHRLPDRKPSARQRGYDAAHDRLSRRVRRMQPWCSGCGAVEELECDHLPIAWERKAAGLPIRECDVQVLCRSCNNFAGAARGPNNTRGDTPGSTPKDPRPQQNFQLYTGLGPIVQVAAAPGEFAGGSER